MFQENRRTKLFAIGATCCGLLTVMLDSTVVNLALPRQNHGGQARHPRGGVLFPPGLGSYGIRLSAIAQAEPAGGSAVH